MLGLLLIYWLGRGFYNLAEKYEKHRWGFAILGIATYYAGTMLTGVLLAFILPADQLLALMQNEILLSLVVVVFGLITYGLMYWLLKNNWSKGETYQNKEILDTDWMNKNEE